MSHHHRSGPLKQSNKKHKTGNHKSKALLTRKCCGKVNATNKNKAGNGCKSTMQVHSKQKRMLRQKQIRDQKKQNLILSRRYAGDNCSGDAPKVIALIGLAEHADLGHVQDEILCDAHELEVSHTNSLQNCITGVYNKLKQKLCIINCGNHFATALDAAKVADIIVYVLPLGNGTESCINAIGENILTALRAQGLPSIVGVLQGLENLSVKSQTELKKYGHRFFQTEFGEDVKITTAAPKQTQSSLARLIATVSPKIIHWREARSYMLGTGVELLQDSLDPDTGTVKISGYVRGKPLSVNQLIHITDVGTFQMSQITSARVVRKSVNEEMNSMAPKYECPSLDEDILAEADEKLQEDLQYEADYDPFAAEQTWPTNEELDKAKQDQCGKEIAAGMSQYQSTWAVSDAENSSEDEEGDEVMKAENDDVEDTEKIDQTFCKPTCKGATSDDEEDDAMSDDNESSRDQAAKFLQLKSKRLQEQEHVDFPDEVDVPANMAAKTRFARYRGVKSLRTSTWDPKESLPVDYARLFQLENFAMVQRRALQRGKRAEQAVKETLRQQLRPLQSRRNSNMSSTLDEDDTDMIDTNASEKSSKLEEDGYVVSGTFVTLHIAKVPLHKLSERIKSGPLIIGALLRHENRLSVLNFSVHRSGSFEDPVKSKESLSFHVGFRRYKARPIYSDQNLKSDLHRYHRFLPQEGWSVATVYGPTTFQPATVLIFRDDESLLSSQLVASGTLKDVNPDRIVLKRVILTGAPVKVKRRKAVIRYMFQSPEDVQWFKPVELSTKFGLTGHIKESLGTHGDLKAIFNKPIKQHDTVCLALYKRVYPKYCDDA